jgi:hypothetical protein
MVVRTNFDAIGADCSLPVPVADSSPPSSVSPVSAASRRAIFREVGLLFLGATVLVSVLYRLRSIPLVESNIAVVAAVAFLYLPALLLWRRGHELEDFGLRFRPIGRSLLLWIALTMLVLPPFGYCYELFVHRLCPQYLMKLVVCPTPIAKTLQAAAAAAAAHCVAGARGRVARGVFLSGLHSAAARRGDDVHGERGFRRRRCLRSDTIW